MDILDVAQLAIFIHGVDETLSVIEEFLGLVPMLDTTTANYILNSHWNVKQGWGRLVSCCQYCYRWRAINDGRKAGAVIRFREKVGLQAVSRGVVGQECVGMVFPHLFPVLL